MPKYCVVDKSNGEQHTNCQHCLFYTIMGTEYDYEIRDYEQGIKDSIDAEHMLVEITSDERDSLREVEHIIMEDGRETVFANPESMSVEQRDLAHPRPINKIKTSKATTKLNMRKTERKTINLHGITYEDDFPVSVIEKIRP